VVSTLFLDIKSTFPSILLNWLTHAMRARGVPWQYINWIARKVRGWCMILSFDRYKSELLALTKGVDQGCPLSGISFQFYNVDLVDL